MSSNEFTHTTEIPQWALHVAPVRADLDEMIHARLHDDWSFGEDSPVVRSRRGWTVTKKLNFVTDCDELEIYVGAGIVTIKDQGRDGLLGAFEAVLERHAIAYDTKSVEHISEGERLRETRRVRYDHWRTQSIQRIEGDGEAQRPTLAQIHAWAAAGNNAAIVQAIDDYNHSLAPAAPLLDPDETNDLPLTVFLSMLHDGAVAGASDESPAGSADLGRLEGWWRESFLASLVHGFARNPDVLTDCVARGFQPVGTDCALLAALQHSSAPDVLQAMRALLAKQSMDAVLGLPRATPGAATGA